MRRALSLAGALLLLVPPVNAASGQDAKEDHHPPVSREGVVLSLNQAAGLLAKGDLAAAAGVLEKALAISPEDPGVTFNLAQVQVRLGRKEEALDLLERLAGRGLGFHPDADPAFSALTDLPRYAGVLASFDRHDPVVTRGKEAFVLTERDLFPEGIACDPSTGALYAGSILKRKIVRIGPDGRVGDFTSSGQDGLLGVLGLKVAPGRRELLAASTAGPEIPEEEGRSGLFRYDLHTGRLMKKLVLPAGVPHNLNDLAIDSAGNVYVTDTADGAIYRASESGGTLEAFLPAGSFRAPNGVAVSGDGKLLYVASSGRGISAVELSSRKVADVAAPKDVVTLGIDGLYFFESSLVGVQNGIGRGRVVRYFLESPTAIRDAEILESRNPVFQVPTTGAICGSDFYYFANTQLDKADEKGRLTPDGQMKDIVILKVTLRAA